jgi:hypothetical protein
MSESDERRERLAVLLADSLAQDEPGADLLLRYARDPDALDSEARERVERYLAESPAHHQQLRSLKRFADSQSERVEDSSQPPASTGGDAVVPIASHPRWRARAVLIGGALAAGLAALLLLRAPADVEPESEAPVRVADPELPAGEAPRAPGSEAPGLEPPAEAIAQAPQTPPVRLEDEAVAPGGEAAPSAPPQPVPPRVEIAESTEPRAVPPDPEVRPKMPAAEEPVLLAMNFSGPLLYTPPPDAIELEPLSGLRSPRPELPAIRALAPAHVARTLNESPTLYWFVSAATTMPVEFVLTDLVSVDPLVELTLTSPVAAGIHAVDLSAHDVLLEPDREYRWFVTLVDAEADPSAQVISRGAIERIVPSAKLRATLAAAAPGERGRIYAEQGLWYDALAFISEGIERAPRDARLRNFRAGLLERAGLVEQANHDHRASETAATP